MVNAVTSISQGAVGVLDTVQCAVVPMCCQPRLHRRLPAPVSACTGPHPRILDGHCIQLCRTARPEMGPLQSADASRSPGEGAVGGGKGWGACGGGGGSRQHEGGRLIGVRPSALAHRALSSPPGSRSLCSGACISSWTLCWRALRASAGVALDVSCPPVSPPRWLRCRLLSLSLLHPNPGEQTASESADIGHFVADHGFCPGLTGPLVIWLRYQKNTRIRCFRRLL